MTAKRTLNPKHERFCQAIAEGMQATEAYLWAGYKGSSRSAAASAHKLLKKAEIKARVAALLQRRQEIEIKATQIAAEKLAITKERVLAELARIGFADIRKAVRWHGALVKEEENPAGGDAILVKTTYSNHVELVSSDELDDDTAGAIAEVSQNTTGGVKIKFHDKRAALVDLGKHLGLFIEKHEHTGKNGGPIEVKDVSDVEGARRIAYMLGAAMARRKNGVQMGA